MMNSTSARKGASTGRGLWPLLGAGVLALSAAACDTKSVVSLPDPDVIGQAVISDTANLPVLRNGVQFEFSRAYAGPAGNNQDPGIIGHGGLLADELWYASTFPTMKEIDGRRIDVANTNLVNVFRYLHRARNLAERAAELYATSPEANGPDHALMLNYAGFTYIYFGENYCSGVPFSESPFSGVLSFGPANTTDQIFNLAIDRFNQVLAMAGAGTTQINMAKIGKARALLNLNQPAAAAAAVAGVPTSFSYSVAFSIPTSAPGNGVWYNINSEKRSSSASQEGTNGLQFFDRTVPGTASAPGNATIDPRVPVLHDGNGLSTTVPHFAQQKYPNRGSPIPVATGIEARLIEAEAQLRAGNFAGAGGTLSILNALRAGSITPALPALADPGTATAQQDLLFRERAFWMYLTAHRLGDLRRLIRQYGRSASSVFPVGVTVFGAQYGPDVNLPIPQAEQNNPEFAGQCLDRNA
jgi:hypothetical protein